MKRTRIPMRDPHRDLTSQRKSYFYTLEAASAEPKLLEHIEGRRDRWIGLQGYMFSEDLRNLLPFGHGLDDGFSAEIVPPKVEVREMVLNSLTSMHRPASILEDGVRHYLEEITQQLLEGQALFEIDYLSSPAKAGTGAASLADAAETDTQPVAFRIGWIPSGTVTKRRGRYIQYVPSDLGEGHTNRGLHYVNLEDQNLVFIDLPRKHKAALRRARTVMQAVDAQQATPHKMLKSPVSGFDHDRFKLQLAQELLRGTRVLGWASRGLYDEHMLDPYTVWRHLQFQRFKVSVRDAGLAGLDQMLDRAGTVLGFKARLLLTGLVTTTDIDQAEADLQSGSRPLIDLLGIHA